MNRIRKTFSKLKKAGKKAFIAYITAGDPTLEKSAELVKALEKTGVNILELGIPFSDPLADGIVNQKAAQRSLQSGASVKKILKMIEGLRSQIKIPIVLFTYFNPILKYGLEQFAKDASSSGVDGILLLDLPPEEGQVVRRLMRRHDIDVIYLIAPTSTPKRVKYISKKASGFIYYVSRTGVTGLSNELSKEIGSKVANIKSQSSVPVVVGFGVSRKEHVQQIASIADGVVVGSAIVKQIEENKDKNELVQHVSRYVEDLIEGMP